MQRRIAPLCLLMLLAACKDGDAPDPTDDSVPVVDQDEDGDGYDAEQDCDDADASVNPGAAEVCDLLDNNCDGQVDEGQGTTWYTDADQDGYGDAGLSTVACAQPEGSSAEAGDCDDSDPAYNPSAAETDCADPNDYNCDGSVGYADNDNDGFPACEECNDADSTIRPDALETCDSIDNNCDGSVDEGVTATYYQDLDGDGFGDADYPVQACEAPAGYTTSSDDCDDADAAVNPSATEVCNSVDDDCDSLIDDADDSLDLSTATRSYTDSDGDGDGDPSASTLSCEVPSGNSLNADDCDDSDSAVNQAAQELCDGVDNNCDGSADGSDAADASTWYSDSDGDGYGDSSLSSLACTQPSGSVADASDCDDSSSAIKPAAAELCDSLDNDCDGVVDPSTATDATTYYPDLDNDGYGDSSGATVKSCTRPSGYRANKKDCDDSDATTYTGATELCDGVDNDCDSSVDDGVLGSSSSCPALNCLEIITDQPSASSGVYSIEPVSGTALSVYCDMSTSGGGWTLAFLKNSVDYDSYSDAGSTYEDVSHLQTNPTTASSSSSAYGGWLNINEFTYTNLRIAAYQSGALTWMSNDIAATDLRIDFGQDGYLLYGDSNGYYWCAGSASYTDGGSGQVNRPSGAPADCKFHGSLGSGWDFSKSTSANAGLTMCGVDAGSRWMYANFGSALYTYPSTGGAQAIWLR